MNSRIPPFCILVLTALLPATAGSSTPSGDPPAARIVGASMTSQSAWQRLQFLTDYVGARPAGSKSLTQALDWAQAELKGDGLLNVRQEKVMVPHWVRGEESAALVEPVQRQLHILGVGSTVGTRSKGIVADVVAVDSFEALEALGKKARGKIVLFNRKMRTDIDSFAAYDEIFEYRSDSASRAAKQGAVAVLVRSLTTRSLQTPHTGGLRYVDGIKKIPAVAVTTEDADLLQRFLDRGESVRVRLELGARMLPDAPSANVIAEIPGRDKPEEIVLVCAHIDSWDVGPGAHDDGTGVVVAMEAAAILNRLGLQPRRTVRVVLFTNEENGLRGAFGYYDRHKDEHHVVGIETDSGGYRPLGFAVEGGPETLAAVQKLAAPLSQVGVNRIKAGFSGVDLIPLVHAGVPGLGLEPDSTHYFDIHHTNADTLDKVDPLDLKLQVAAMSLLVWQLAEADEALPAGKPKK